MSAGVADWVPIGINSICSKIALTLTSAVGTTRTFRDVRFCVVIGGIADTKRARYEHSDLCEVVEALVDDGKHPTEDACPA